MPTVYGVGLSPFVRKVRVMLAEKRVPYQLEPVLPGNPDPEFRRISPLGKIPAFRDGDRTLCDSSVVCQYLERIHPEPPMYPSEAYQFARALWFEEYADTTLVEVFGPKIFFPRVVGKRLMGREPDEPAVQKAIDEDVPPRCDYLESQLGDGPYLAGDRFSVADVAITTMFAHLQHADVAVDAARWPKLAAYIATHLARPTFAALIQEEKAFLGTA